MMPRSLTTTLLAALTAVTLTACVTTTEQGVRPAEGQSGSSDVRVDESTWSASFPGDVVREQQPFPVDGVGELTAELTYWETSTEALLVQVVSLPSSDNDAAANLLSTASTMGTVIPDSPLLDADGTFRGLPAVVVEAQQDSAAIELLAFYAEPVLFQLMHVTSSTAAPDRLTALVASFELQ